MGVCLLPLALLQQARAAVGVLQPQNRQSAEVQTTGIQATEANALIVAPAVQAAVQPFTDLYIAEHAQFLNNLKKQQANGFVLIRNLLEKEGVPAELVYIAVIESKMKNSATSYAGAAGIWQLMPATAKKLGLKITTKEDQRRNIYKSTEAAAKYLNNLYNEFDDWLLAIAAYNCGAGNVHKAIKKAGSRDFRNLQSFLPKESREHVKRFIAVLFYYEEQTRKDTIKQTEHAQQSLVVAEKPKQLPTDTPAPRELQVRWILITQQEDDWILIPRK